MSHGIENVFFFRQQRPSPPQNERSFVRNENFDRAPNNSTQITNGETKAEMNRLENIYVA